MNKDLAKLREVFLADDVDADDRADNEAKLLEWETALISGENFLSWQAHDTTKQILAQAKATFLDTAVALGTNPTLAEPARAALFAKQDAARWLINLIDVNAKGAIEAIERELAAAIARAM